MVGFRSRAVRVISSYQVKHVHGHCLVKGGESLGSTGIHIGFVGSNILAKRTVLFVLGVAVVAESRLDPSTREFDGGDSVTSGSCWEQCSQRCSQDQVTVPRHCCAAVAVSDYTNMGVIHYFGE